MSSQEDSCHYSGSVAVSRFVLFGLFLVSYYVIDIVVCYLFINRRRVQ